MSAVFEQAVGDALVGSGVDVVFGLMGTGNLSFISRLISRGVKYVPCRHESGVLAMAYAWAKVTGRVGVCTVTRGPGLTNAITGLVEARKGKVPLLLMVGKPADPAHPQYLEQRELIEGVNVTYCNLGAVNTNEEVERALQYVRLAGVPIVIELGERTADSAIVPSLPDALRTVPDDENIAAATSMLQMARRPVILAGRGAVESGARKKLEALADLSGALLTSSAMANGMFSGHPSYVGVCGGFSTPTTKNALRETDLVIAFGASLNQWTMGQGTLFRPSARFIQCDSAQDAFGKYRPVDVRLLGDANEVADLLIEGCMTERPTIKARQIVEPESAVDPTSVADGPTGLDPDLLCRVLAQILPPKLTVSVDSGHFFGFAVRHIRPDDGKYFVFSQAFLSLGLGIASGIGASIARPGVIAVSVLGDGGTLMSLGELETAVRLKLPLLLVILNDAAYGAEVRQLQALELPVEAAQFDDIDFASVAESLGAQGCSLRHYTDLGAVREWLKCPSGPFVLDCKVDPDVTGDWFDKTHAG